MALKIRLRQQGRKNRLSYRLVVTDARFPRDGKYLEMVGWYDPHGKEKDALIKEDRIAHWLGVGAVLTEKAKSLVKRTAPEVMHALLKKEQEQKVKKAAKRLERKKGS